MRSLDELDHATTRHRRQMLSVSPQSRKALSALAGLDRPATAREVADAARLDPSTASSVLGRLVGRLVSLEQPVKRPRKFMIDAELGEWLRAVKNSRRAAEQRKD